MEKHIVGERTYYMVQVYGYATYRNYEVQFFFIFFFC